MKSMAFIVAAVSFAGLAHAGGAMPGSVYETEARAAAYSAPTTKLVVRAATHDCVVAATGGYCVTRK